jgi:hypothetical protein
MAASVTGVEAWSNSVATTFAPSGGATGTSGGTTSGTLSCVPCCNSGIKYLPGWFSYADPSRGLADGLCPGAVDNSVPVTVYATFNLTPATGVSLADYCIPSSFTIEMIANDPYNPSRLKPLAYSTSCSPIYPGTRYGFLDIIGKGFFTASVNTGSNPYILAYLVNMCSCNNVGYLAFSSYYIPTTQYSPTIYGSLDSCSPFSLTFSKNYPYNQLANFYWQNTWVGTWSVTFTL